MGRFGTPGAGTPRAAPGEEEEGTLGASLRGQAPDVLPGNTNRELSQRPGTRWRFGKRGAGGPAPAAAARRHLVRGRRHPSIRQRSHRGRGKTKKTPQIQLSAPNVATASRYSCVKPQPMWPGDAGGEKREAGSTTEASQPSTEVLTTYSIVRRRVGNRTARPLRSGAATCGAGTNRELGRPCPRHGGGLGAQGQSARSSSLTAGGGVGTAAEGAGEAGTEPGWDGRGTRVNAALRRRHQP